MPTQLETHPSHVWSSYTALLFARPSSTIISKTKGCLSSSTWYAPLAILVNSWFSIKDLPSLHVQVRYDMRGHGRTEMPSSADGYLSHLYVEDFAAVMDEFKVKKPFLVGW